ncbi:MAG TPA: hypothetical protein VME46_20255 [Acidimicrobiales bacterium]|nr:hypothetical protein [Acidimicrobiales bacterium]
MTGARLSGALRWSNHHGTDVDRVASPHIRGVIISGDGAEVNVEMRGRACFFEQDEQWVGRQLFMTLFDSAAEDYAWLNREVGMAEGRCIPKAGVFHVNIYLCRNDLV